MDTGLEVTIDDAEFEAKLRNIILQLQPGSQTAGLMRAIGYYMRKRTVGHFADEKDPEGKPWEQLAGSTLHGRMSTAKWHSYQLQGKRISRRMATIVRAEIALGKARKDSTRTKALDRIKRAKEGMAKPTAKRENLRHGVKILQDTRWLVQHIESVSDATSAEIGTNVFYAPFHQFGAPRAHIPIRAFLGVADEDAEGITNLAWDYLARVTGG